jgi:ornithine carbamoyltransferase
MTVHKSQGITVDQTRVLVTDRWDRHLSYVGMSRHKAHLQLYVSRELEDPVNVMQRTRVQENALEFAQRQGIDITRALPAVKRPVEVKKEVMEKPKSVRPELQPERTKKAVLRTQDKPRGRGR